ncbi:hypothetical protein CF087_17860 [Clostridium botulinum]|nr:hypothetical protein [Clostridium botulinum]
MNVEQVEKMNKSILENAIDWANNRDCLPLEQYDIIVIGEYYKIKIPSCFHNFVCSENPNHIETYGAEKTIYKTLDKIVKHIQKVNNDLK